MARHPGRDDPREQTTLLPSDVDPRGSTMDASRSSPSAGPSRSVPTVALGPAVAPTATPVDGTLLTPDEALPPGTHVHQFEIIRELGRGGMGRVYLARDTRLARRVALKFLLAATEDLQQRFLVEARNTARCQHDNIVVIYEVDEWRGAPYMALEFLDGTPLSAVIEDQPLLVGRAIEVLIPVVRALVRAHEHGIVHCDLKPENILLTAEGSVKVLDFGIARLLGMAEDGQVCGTPRYMAPEQWGADTIDHRTDLWAIGIILWELLTRQHPLGSATMSTLLEAAAAPDVVMPRLSATFQGVPSAVDTVIARCLAKSKADRYSSARELLTALEAIAPSTQRLRDADSPPYPGMVAFGEDDADRFFGRTRDIARITARLVDAPLLVIAGPSGVGKSSLVRAGVLPALSRGGEAWTSIVVRPGRDPLAAIAAKASAAGATVDAAVLLDEPGRLGVVLRAQARRTHQRLLVFVDQFEELFTNVEDPRARSSFLAALAGAADDASSPVRVVLSVRSDFLDRVADDPVLRDLVAAGLVFLRGLGTSELREALERPLETTGYRLESSTIIDDIIRDVGDTPGALPLVQFVASELWNARDRATKLLTRAAYAGLGGIAGALAGHAEQVVRELPPTERGRLEGLLGRLVTSEGTRAVLDRHELEAESPGIETLLDRLISARLLASGTGDDRTVELVHESLIHAWPTLRRWREERGEHAAFLAQVRTAAQQWVSRGRPAGLLWSGDAIPEIRLFRQRYRGELGAREQEFLDTALAVADRGARRRRRMAAAGVLGLLLIAAGALVAVVMISRARTESEQQASRARAALEEYQAAQLAKDRAEQERVRAEASRVQAEAERTAARTGQQEAEVAKDQALLVARQAGDDLAVANTKLEQALQAARAEARRAKDAQAVAEAARRDAEAATAKALAAEAEQRRRAQAAEQKAAGLAKQLE